MSTTIIATHHMTKTAWTERIFQVTRIALIALFAGMLVAALHPDVRSEVRGAIVQDYRTVVSTAQGHLAGDNRNYIVAKVKSRDSLSLEVFEMNADGTQKLVEKIVMPDVKDGYFNFNGRATNLAIDDLNGDGHWSIIAPSFDANLVGRLNVYNFDPNTHSFQRIIR